MPVEQTIKIFHKLLKVIFLNTHSGNVSLYNYNYNSVFKEHPPTTLQEKLDD